MRSLIFKRHLKETLALAGPITASKAGAQVITILNFSMVGRIGTSALSHFGLATTPFFTLNLVGLCLLSGLSFATARARAAGDFEEVARQGRSAAWLWIVVSTALIASTLLYWALPVSQNLGSETREVLLVLVLGAPAFIGYFCVSNFLEGMEQPRASAWVTIAGAAANFSLNIWGLNQFSKLLSPEVIVALGMVATRWLMFLTLVAWSFRKLLRVKSRIQFWPGIRDLSGVPFHLKFGAPIAFAYGLRSGALSGLTIAASALGAPEVAAFSLAIQLMNLGNMIATSVSSATIVRISRFVGLKNRAEVRRSVQASLLIMALGLIVIASTLGAFAEKILPSLSKDPDVTAILSRSLGFVLAFFSVDCLCTVLMGSLRPLGDRWIPQAGFGAILFVVGVPLSWFSIRYFAFGIGSMFLSMILAYLLAGAFVFHRAQRTGVLRTSAPYPNRDNIGQNRA